MQIDKKLLLNQHRQDLRGMINGALSEEMIEGLARSTGFVKRCGKIPAPCFVNSLLASQSSGLQTSLPDLAADINELFAIDVSKEAVHQKFTPEAVDFFKALLAKLLSTQLEIEASTDVKLHFPAIKIKDSTKFSLPFDYNGEYKGYGNFSKKNGLMSIQYEYDLVSKQWLSIEITQGLRNDQTDSRETIAAITKGDLHLRDLGYITPTYLSGVVNTEGYFLNRLPPQAGAYRINKKPINWKTIDRMMKRTNTPSIDLDVLVYEEQQIPCRLIIERVTDTEYCRRLKKAEERAKSSKVGLTDQYKLKLQFNTFITNVDADILPIPTIRKTYYLRWQIELVFKTWKSFFNLNQVKKVKKERLECQLLAKLLWILINWTLFRRCCKHVEKVAESHSVSLLLFFKRCKMFAATLRLVLLKRIPIKSWLEHVYLPLIINCACEAPRKKSTHHESLKVNIKPLA